MPRFRPNLCLGTMWPNLLMWMCHVSFNYLLTTNFVNVPRVNIVIMPCVTKQLANCSTYIVCNLIEIVIIFLGDIMPS